MFSGGLTLTDMARERGKSGARLFDSEGVATTNLPLIENGVVKNFFVNTYTANKTGEEPTVEDISRPVLKNTRGTCRMRRESRFGIRKKSSTFERYFARNRGRDLCDGIQRGQLQPCDRGLFLRGVGIQVQQRKNWPAFQGDADYRQYP